MNGTLLDISCLTGKLTQINPISGEISTNIKTRVLVDSEGAILIDSLGNKLIDNCKGLEIVGELSEVTIFPQTLEYSLINS